MSTLETRTSWVEEANHSVYLEGLTVSAEYVEESQNYVAGKISADELVRITRERYGLK
ncbi:hypothetical protein [Glutamicibacter sp.]|uniref:antitoxin VbhA family protein n=1 Tax=Glutamicibacter sp. TaxID=1931995 RepID=UPI0028BDE678|nr:hypothetical protein [Glutamicibacter sp.]